MYKKIMCLFAVSLLSGTTVLCHSSDSNSTTTHKKPQTSLISTGTTGYGIGLATGLMPILMPVTAMSLAGNYSGITKKEATVYLSSMGAGFLTGLGVWYAAISHWLKYLKS